MNKKEIIQTVLAFITIVTAIIGFNAYFAKASELELVAMRLEQKIVSDATMQTQDRIWKLLDRNESRECKDIKVDRDREECRKLEQNIKELDQKNKILIEKTIPK